MKHLNLTEGFNPFGVHPESVNLINFEKFFFNGGEPHIKIRPFEADNVVVTTRLKSMDDLGMLLVATEALRQSSWLENKATALFIPYFPGSRQDRRMVDGEPLTSKIFAKLINDLGYDQVITFDNHSDVTTALLDNVENRNNHIFVDKCVNKITGKETEADLLIISPDTGANKKCFSLVKAINKYHNTLPIKCDKVRNIEDGSLFGFEVYADDLTGKDCIIVDDICDGGGTFIGLAKELKKKNAGDLYLAVSHGIFSKGFKELNKYFKGIYTTDSWRTEISMETPEIEKGSENVTIIPFKDFL